MKNHLNGQPAGDLTSNRDQDLHWDAFRYVSGDMQQDERQAFEDMLENDQSAREAVAAAVELGSVLSVQEALPAVKSRVHLRPATVGWACVSLSACLAIAWFAFQPLVFPLHSTPTADHVTPPSPTDAAKLAMLWSETREELADGSEQDAFWTDVTAELEMADVLLDETNTTPDVVTPDWMLAGIKSLEDAQTPAPDDMDMNTNEGEES